MAVIPEQYTNLLYTTALAHIATVGPQGEPQSTPVWFDFDGTYIRFSQTKNRQKYRNLLRDPRIALSVVDPSNPYRYLEIRGKVVRIDEDPKLDFINAMAKKYLGKDRYPWHQAGDERVVVVIEPEHTTHMGEAATRGRKAFRPLVLYERSPSAQDHAMQPLPLLVYMPS